MRGRLTGAGRPAGIAAAQEGWTSRVMSPRISGWMPKPRKAILRTRVMPKEGLKGLCGVSIPRCNTCFQVFGLPDGFTFTAADSRRLGERRRRRRGHPST